MIYDTPSAMDYADAFVVASRVGAALIVARKNEATFDDVAKMSAKLRAMDCNIIGSVFNKRMNQLNDLIGASGFG